MAYSKGAGSLYHPRYPPPGKSYAEARAACRRESTARVCGPARAEGEVTMTVPWGNRFALFIADRNGGIYTTAGDPQAGFGPWASVSEGNSTPGAPVTAVRWGNHFAVYVADRNGGIYTTAGDPQAGFGPWAGKTPK